MDYGVWLSVHFTMAKQPNKTNDQTTARRDGGVMRN